MSTSTIAIDAATTSQTIRIVREDQRVWLEGVRGFNFGERQCSTLATQAELMRALGESISYEDLVGGSALAFRVQAYKPSMCPSAAHAMVGQRCETGAFLPWTLRAHFFAKPEAADYAQNVAAGRAMVKASIDRGTPAILVGDEDGLIIGYQKEGEEWICLHPLRDRGHKSYIETNLPWCVAVVDAKRSELPPARDVGAAAIQKAIAMWTADSDRYYIGEKAWQVWIQRLEDANAGKPQPHDMQMGNAWMYDTLLAYRRNAAGYLRSIARHFAPDSQAHLLRAAELYEKMANTVLCSAGETLGDIAPYPSKEPNWTAAQRQDQIRRLREAFALDRQAVGELQLAIPAR